MREAHAKVVEYAQRASALDPDLAEPYAVLGFSEGKFAGKLIEQFTNFEHALKLEPADVTTNFWYGLGLIKAGYRERGIKQLDRGLAIDPMLPNLLRWRGVMYFDAGDLPRAEQMVRRARDLGLQPADLTLAEIAGARGDGAVAARLWVAGTQATFRGMSDEDRGRIAAGIYGDAAGRAPAIALIERYLAKPHEHVSRMVPTALLHLGQPARALEVMRSEQITDTSDLLALLWSPQGRPIRGLPEFQPFLRDFGFTAVWDTYGPPDLCKKNVAGDYACE